MKLQVYGFSGFFSFCREVVRTDLDDCPQRNEAVWKSSLLLCYQSKARFQIDTLSLAPFLIHELLPV